MLQSRAAFSGFSVNNIAKAKEFYTKTLPLKLVDETMGLRLELPGGGQVFIYEKPDHRPASFTILNFIVEDIDKAVDGLAGQGVTFERYEQIPYADEKGIVRGLANNMGPDIAWFKDPAENIVSVLQVK